MGTRSGLNEERWVQQTTVCTKITFQIQFTKTTIIIIVIITIINTIVSKPAVVICKVEVPAVKGQILPFVCNNIFLEQLINQKHKQEP